MNWEYKIVKLDTGGFGGGKVNQAQLDHTLNELGAQGWELAAAFDTSRELGGTRDLVVIFKRPKS